MENRCWSFMILGLAICISMRTCLVRSINIVERAALILIGAVKRLLQSLRSLEMGAHVTGLYRCDDISKFRPRSIRKVNSDYLVLEETSDKCELDTKRALVYQRQSQTIHTEECALTCGRSDRRRRVVVDV